MSPPRIRGPPGVRPSVSEREIDETPAIAATPSAMQPRKIPNPVSPPKLAQCEAKHEARDAAGGESGAWR